MKPSPDVYFASVAVVGFDVDETLLDEAFSLRSRWQQTLQKFAHLSKDLEDTFLRIFDSKGHTHATHLQDTFDELRMPDVAPEPLVEYFRTMVGTEHTYPYVQASILALKQRSMRVGVITDGRQDYQEARLKRAGLFELFDFFYYGDVYQKPNPAFFRMCIQDERIQPHELLYIGDHVARDIEGALAVGVKAIWISHESTQPCPEGALQFKTMYNFYQWLTSDTATKDSLL